MDKRCKNCGALLSHDETVCPYCEQPVDGAATAQESGVPKTGKPTTIAQLKEFALAHNLPLEKMRFFIGEDYKQPRAFGIYEENGNFIVYKNKADGTRAIRYSGPDEAFAVNELYEKMRSEVANQKARIAAQRGSSTRQSGGRTSSKMTSILVVVIVIIAAIVIRGGGRKPSRGYYNYGGDYYYYQAGSWFLYNAIDGWYYTDPPTELEDDYRDYYSGSSYRSEYGTDDFYNSGYYQEDTSSSSDDDDWDWDSGDDWDSSSTDWDSDW